MRRTSHGAASTPSRRAPPRTRARIQNNPTEPWGVQSFHLDFTSKPPTNARDRRTTPTALEHLRRRIEAQSERYTEAERRRKEAKEAWERAEADAGRERGAHEALVNDFQTLLEQKSKAQSDRMAELTLRLEELSSAVDDGMTGPRATSKHADGKHPDAGRSPLSAGPSVPQSASHTSASLDEEPTRPVPGFSFFDNPANDLVNGVERSTDGGCGVRDGGRGVEGRGGAERRTTSVVDEYVDAEGGWEGDVMYEGGNEGVVAWSALNAGEEERRAQAAKAALGSIQATKETRASSSRGGSVGVGGPDGMKIVMTKSGGYSGVAPGQQGGSGARGLGRGGASYGCTIEHSGSAIVGDNRTAKPGNTKRRK